MSCECEFAAKIPIDCVREVIGMVSAGSFGRGEVLCHAGCALGQIGALVKQWSGPAIGADAEAPEVPDSLNGVLDALDAALTDDSAEKAYGANPFISALLAKLVSLLLEYLDDAFDESPAL